MYNKDFFKNKFRISSARLSSWDYSSNGYYFVTICTKEKRCWFGEIRNRKMILSDVGRIVYDEWLKTKRIRQNIDLDEFQIMPNHMHGIIIIKNNINVETPRRGVSTNKYRHVNKNDSTNKWKPNSLGSIVNQFKSICTKRIWKSDYPNFSWQPRFYDHIIRNETSLNKIREYIRFNPNNWNTDEENPEVTP